MTTTRRLQIIVDQGGNADSGLKSISSGLASLGTKAVLTAGAGLAALGTGAVAVGSKLLDLGSDAAEMQGKFDVVFSKTGKQVTKDLSDFGHAVGRSKYELMGYASTLGDTLKPMGFAEADAADLSTTLTELAVDLGSFNNMETDEALRRLQGTLIGSHENALAFGVVINENTLKAELAANGWDKLTGAELEQAKVQARINLLIKGTTDAQGDAARTAGGWANQMRGLKATVTDAATSMGLKLLPVVTPLLAKLGEMANQALPVLVSVFENRVVPAIETVIGFLGNLTRYVIAVVEDGDTLNDWLAHLPEGISPFVKAVGDTIVKIQEWAGIIANFVSNHAEEFKGALIAIGAVLAGAAIVAGIAAIAGVIASLASPVGLIIAAAALLGAAWAGNWGGIQEKTFAVIEWFKANVIPTIQAAFGWITGTALPYLQRTWETVWQAVLTAVNAVLPIIKNIIAAWQAALNGDWYTFGSKLREAWQGLWTLIITIARTVGREIIKFMASLVVDVIKKIKSTDWGAVGRAMMEGLARGIRNGASIIVNAAKDAARAAFEATKGFLGIHSPSTKFEWLGEQSDEGLARGFTKKGQAPAASASLAGRFANAYAAGASAGGAGEGGGAPIIVQFTYAPVISTADKIEAEQVLAPMIGNVVRKVMGR